MTAHLVNPHLTLLAQKRGYAIEIIDDDVSFRHLDTDEALSLSEFKKREMMR